MSNDARDAAPVIVISGPPGAGKSTISRLVAAAFDRSVHLQTDDLMASVVSGWVDPNLPDASPQHAAIGAALAVSAFSFAEHGYATVVDGHLFPAGVDGIATACAARGLRCHYVVLTADLDTCWARARDRVPGRWPLEREQFEALHARYADLELDDRHDVAATGSAATTCDRVLAALAAGRLLATAPTG